MLKVGITGGIGSGKSTIAHLYEMMGYPVYYADDRAKWLMNNSVKIKKQLIATFGIEVYPDELDRKVLANKVFSNPEALGKLNAIVHPAVRQDIEAWNKEQDSPIVFREAAILFESGTNDTADKVICVCAPKITRVMRVMKRDNCSSAQVEERMGNQWTDEQKAALSDYILNTDDTQLVIPKAIEVLEQLKEQI